MLPAPAPALPLAENILSSNIADCVSAGGAIQNWGSACLVPRVAKAKWGEEEEGPAYNVTLLWPMFWARKLVTPPYRLCAVRLPGAPLGLGGCPCCCLHGCANHKRQLGIHGSKVGPPCRVIGHVFPEIQCNILDHYLRHSVTGYRDTVE